MFTQKVKDLYVGKDKFQFLLLQAEENAKNAWEEEFINKMMENFDKYGMDMFLSDLQDQTLSRIISGERK